MYRDRTNEMHQYVEELNKTFQGTWRPILPIIAAINDAIQRTWAPCHTFGWQTTTTTTCGFSGRISNEN
jgi:hypothetical protein